MRYMTSRERSGFSGELLIVCVRLSSILCAMVLTALGGCNTSSTDEDRVSNDQDDAYSVEVPSNATEWIVTAESLQELQEFLEDRWPVERVKAFYTMRKPTHPEMQNLMCEDTEYGSLLHEDGPDDSGVIFWYACTSDRVSWTYTVNVVRQGEWWWLEKGSLRTRQEFPDALDYRLGGRVYESMIKAVGKELRSVD